VEGRTAPGKGAEGREEAFGAKTVQEGRGMSTSRPEKEGYEPTKEKGGEASEDAYEDRNVYVATGVPLYRQDGRPFMYRPVETEQEERHWDGHLLQCWGSECSLLGWLVCCVVMWVPCLAYGRNMNQALRKSFFWQAVLYFLLAMGLQGLVNSMVEITCPFKTWERMGANGEMVEVMHKSCLKYHYVRSAFYPLYFVGIIYFAYRRNEVREKFNIAGSSMGDFLSWLCCASCALCQETRTIALYIRDGEWIGRRGANGGYASLPGQSSSPEPYRPPQPTAPPSLEPTHLYSNQV